MDFSRFRPLCTSSRIERDQTYKGLKKQIRGLTDKVSILVHEKEKAILKAGNFEAKAMIFEKELNLAYSVNGESGKAEFYKNELSEERKRHEVKNEALYQKIAKLTEFKSKYESERESNRVLRDNIEFLKDQAQAAKSSESKRKNPRNDNSFTKFPKSLRQ